MNKRSLCISALGAIGMAMALAGCGSTYYFAGRTLPPSGLSNRVMVAIQNPSALGRGSLEILDAHYDTRYAFNNISKTFSVSGYSGALPITIQNMPEEQLGYVYGSGDGSLVPANYAKEDSTGALKGLSGTYSSIFMTRNQNFVFATSQINHSISILDNTNGSAYSLSLPGVYRLSVNPGGSAALFFVQNSNSVYYALKLSAPQTLSFAGGPGNWPKAAVDCEPQNAPGWCLLQAQSPDSTDKYGMNYGAALQFDRPIKALFSNDGSIAYVLNCGPECGGATASVSLLPVGPTIFTPNQQSGSLPKTTALQTACGSAPNLTACTLAIPGGASNALIDSTTMYIVGQKQMADNRFGGYLTVVNLATNSIASPAVSVSDGTPGGMSRMIEADDDTLWIGMTQCTNGERFNNPNTYPDGYGCLTMYNTSTKKVTLEPYMGDATGIAAVTSLHKVYVAQGGQVYIYATTDGRALDNQYVTVTGTAYDVAYMDGLSDANNTVY